MCNCGKKRNRLNQQPVSFNKTNIEVMPLTLQNQGTVLLQYIGSTALTVTGKNTRKIYRFNYNGDKQLIDVSDAAAMIAIPVLKKVT